MDKKIAGKYAGLTGAVALIITIICQITHNGGLPWSIRWKVTIGIVAVIQKETDTDIFYVKFFLLVLLRGLKDE